MLTELHEVAAARVEEDSIKLSYAKIFSGRKVRVVMDTIEDIDTAGKQLKGVSGTYSYDILVMAAGSKPTYFGIQGAEEKAFKLWSYDDAVILREQIRKCFRAAARETNPEERRKLLSFFTVGAGFTGTEMAGELAEWVPVLCHQYEIDPSEVSMYMADLLDRVVPTMPPKYCARCHKRLTKMGVKIMLKHNVTEIGDDFIDLKDGEQLKRVEARTIIWAAGTQGETIAQKASETIPGTRRGRLESDEFLRSKGDESVYIIGDVLQYTPEGEKLPVPQVVENAEASAECAVHNILVQLTGKGAMHKYAPKFHGVMVCVGGRWGSAYVGTANHKFGLPSFLAMFAKHFVNLIYFVKVMGWTKVFSYMKHEFFTVRNNRSFVGGHFSNNTPSFLLVALRVWLGLVWVFEAVRKIVEGWFTAPMLASVRRGLLRDDDDGDGGGDGGGQCSRLGNCNGGTGGDGCGQRSLFGDSDSGGDRGARRARFGDDCGDDRGAVCRSRADQLRFPASSADYPADGEGPDERVAGRLRGEAQHPHHELDPRAHRAGQRRDADLCADHHRIDRASGRACAHWRPLHVPGEHRVARFAGHVRHDDRALPQHGVDDLREHRLPDRHRAHHRPGLLCDALPQAPLEEGPLGQEMVSV
jgi:NADH dehydrogenase FAD-containing subunit